MAKRARKAGNADGVGGMTDIGYDLQR